MKHMTISGIMAIGLTLLMLGVSGPAQGQDAGLDEALRGFGDDRSDTTKTDSPEVPEDEGPTRQEAAAGQADTARFDLNGSLGLSSAVNLHPHQSMGAATDYSGLSRLRLTLDLDMDTKFSEAWDATLQGRAFYDASYSINGRDHYTDQVLSSLESEIELREAFIRGKVLPFLDIKAGRQIVVWGKSDNLRVTDVLNPLDNREPGMVDIEDLRLPLTMTRMDLYSGRWNLSAIAIHEIRFNKNPAYGSDFYPYPIPPTQEEIPSDGGGNTEYAFALNGNLTGWDISFYTARMFDDRPHVEYIPGPVLRHSRLTMAGTAVNVAKGNWLFKSEAALFSGLEFSNLPSEQKSRYDILVGAEYSGFTETMLSFEVVNRHIMKYDDSLAVAPDSALQDDVQTALRFQKDYMHDRLHLTVLAMTNGWNGRQGRLQRMQAEYELSDSIMLTAGLVNYSSGNRLEFRHIGKNDRAFVEIKYSF